MKFFFPDSQDQIDPSFDFLTEQRSIFRVRQRDDHYAHEALRRPPFDGLLVSKTIVDGLPGTTGKYTLSQQQRLYRVGVREFFRLDQAPGPRIATLGDCGAFTYRRDDIPPYTPDEVIDFYAECGFDLGISVDHVIIDYDPNADHHPGHPHLAEWRRRQQLTLDLAAEFLTRHRSRRARFAPVGVAQGWSPTSYATAVHALQTIGYHRVAIGGMAPRKTDEILACLQAIEQIRQPTTQLHLLGITRCENVEAFTACGVSSFDSTSAFQQSFKDDRDNFHSADRTYTALRVPQVDGNYKLKNRIRAGQISQDEATRLEDACLNAIRCCDAGTVTISTALGVLRAYDELCDGRKDRTKDYREILQDRPWRHCPCGICEQAGVEVALFRGSERNKRRGFHNLYVFNQRLQRALKEGSAA